jgi:TetR/AcrR family transcriptional repressor of mexJK operon
VSIRIDARPGVRQDFPAQNRERTATRMSQPSTASRMRQPSPRKHEAILAAAVDCFAANGYAATSMDAIAAAAGVSKQTVYHHFGDKNALFKAAIGRVSDMISRPLLAGHAHDLPPLETLTIFGRHILEFLLCGQSLAFMRLLIAEAPKFEGLADAVIQLGMESTTQVMARYLAEETARRRLAVDEPRRAALMFFGMLVSEYRFRGLLGVQPSLSPAEMDTHARVVAGAFLRAFGPD